MDVVAARAARVVRAGVTAVAAGREARAVMVALVEATALPAAAVLAVPLVEVVAYKIVARSLYSPGQGCRHHTRRLALHRRKCRLMDSSTFRGRCTRG